MNNPLLDLVPILRKAAMTRRDSATRMVESSATPVFHDAALLSIIADEIELVCAPSTQHEATVADGSSPGSENQKSSDTHVGAVLRDEIKVLRKNLESASQMFWKPGIKPTVDAAEAVCRTAEAMLDDPAWSRCMELEEKLKAVTCAGKVMEEQNNNLRKQLDIQKANRELSDASNLELEAEIDGLNKELASANKKLSDYRTSLRSFIERQQP